VWIGTLPGAGGSEGEGEDTTLSTQTDNVEYQVDRPLFRSAVDRYRVAALNAAARDPMVLSPVLVGLTPHRRLQRETQVRAAALQALGDIFEWAIGDTRAFEQPVGAGTAAVRRSDPLHGGLDQHANRMAADVMFAVAQALRIAVAQIGSIPWAPGATTSTKHASRFWQFALAKPAAEELWDSLAGNQRGAVRAQGRITLAAHVVRSIVAIDSHSEWELIAARFAGDTLRYYSVAVTPRHLGYNAETPRRVIARDVWGSDPREPLLQWPRPYA
jgi:hypothetical protein